MDEKDLNFPEALEWLAKIVGFKDIPVHYPFGGFYRSLVKYKKDIDLEIYPEDALPPPDALPQMWFKDGVDYLTQERYGIRLDFDSNRIVIPARDYEGQLVGAKGRYNGDCPMDERWSMYIPYAKSLVLYGWNENKEHIVQKQRVYIVEAEKSVCQAAGARSVNGAHGMFRRTVNATMMATMATATGRRRVICGFAISNATSKNPGISSRLLWRLAFRSPCRSADSARVQPHPGQYRPVFW